MPEYKTVLKEAEDSFVEKKSRFIGHCRPVTTEEEAQGFIKSIKTKHWDASHNVSAYVLRSGGVMRYSDDGEPQGTAGIPVLDVLKKSGTVDAVVVVTRYFGGTLLGAGGLVRAYSHGASLALGAAEPVLMRECLLLSLRCAYNRYTKAQEIVQDLGGVVDETAFDDGVTLGLHLLPDAEADLRQKIADLTAGQGIVSKLGSDYFGFPINFLQK